MPVLQSKLNVTWPYKLAVFCFFFAVYMITIQPSAISSDCLYMLRVSQSIVEDHDIHILNQTAKDPIEFMALTSRFPLLPSLVGVPFYALGKAASNLMKRPLSAEELLLITTFSGPFIGALTCLLLFQFVLALGFNARAAFLTVCSYGLGTSAWAHLTYLGTEPVAALTILAAVYTAYLYKSRRRYFWVYLSGFFAGAAVAARDLSIFLVVPPVLLYLIVLRWQSEKNHSWRSNVLGAAGQTFVFALGVLPFILLSIWYTFVRYGGILNSGYLSQTGKISGLFDHPVLVGLFGFLFSAGEGLFWWCPIFVLGFIFFRSFYQRYKLECLLFSSVFLLHLLAYSRFAGWFGGGSFGPRYLAPVLSMLAFPLALFFEKWELRPARLKIVFLFLFSIGVITQTAVFWGEPAFDWRESVGITETYDAWSEEGVYHFLPHSNPLLLWVCRPIRAALAQCLLLPNGASSRRLPLLLALLVTAAGAGIYLVHKLRILPDRNSLQRSKAFFVAVFRRTTRCGLAYRAEIAAGALALVLLIMGGAVFSMYVWPPLTQVHIRPVGAIEYPISRSYYYIEEPKLDQAPVLVGKFEAGGWALDPSGLRALEVYVDQVKVDDVQYGLPSPDIQEAYPKAPGSGRARFVATGIDTAKFGPGFHALSVRALSQNGVWFTIAGAALKFFDGGREYDFWAPRSEADSGAAEYATIIMDGEERRVLLQSLDSVLTFEKVPVYEGGAFLKIGVGLQQEDAPGDRGAIIWEVLANGKTSLYASTIDAQAFKERPQWREEWVDLRPFQNQVITLTFRVKTPTGQDKDIVRVAWSDLGIHYAEE